MTGLSQVRGDGMAAAAARRRRGERRGQQGGRELSERNTYRTMGKDGRQEPKNQGTQGRTYETIKKGR